MCSEIDCNMLAQAFIIWIAVFALNAFARCPNSCSGHGSCGVSNICTCYPQWDGGAADCSSRELSFYSFRNITLSYDFKISSGVCPFGTAWADKAYAPDVAHQSAECSNAGICDRSSGNCKCFPGFTGNACQRSKFLEIITAEIT